MWLHFCTWTTPWGASFKNRTYFRNISPDLIWLIILYRRFLFIFHHVKKNRNYIKIMSKLSINTKFTYSLYTVCENNVLSSWSGNAKLECFGWINKNILKILTWLRSQELFILKKWHTQCFILVMQFSWHISLWSGI